jgi:hypothetical protein
MATASDSTPIHIMFNNEGDDEWQVEFYRSNTQSITGEGDAQRIFSTVLSAIQQFIQKEQPWRIIFSASKDVEPGQNNQSRAKLYNSLVKRYARAWGYDEYSEDHGDQVTYELTRLKQPVNEESAPEILYHATYRPLLKSIKQHGLGGDKAQAKWEDSKPGVVYLAIDPNVAESYAESSDVVPDEWLDQIVVLKVNASQLDQSKLKLDSNVIDNQGDTLEYHGVIPVNLLS